MYYFSTTINSSFDSAIEQVTQALQKEGFGIISDIDVKATMKKKLDVDFRKYRILGACNPGYAHKALQTEDKVGTMLPCNVIVQETSEQNIMEVSAINPQESMMAIDNASLEGIASEITERLKRVIESLKE